MFIFILLIITTINCHVSHSAEYTDDDFIHIETQTAAPQPPEPPSSPQTFSEAIAPFLSYSWNGVANLFTSPQSENRRRTVSESAATEGNVRNNQNQNRAIYNYLIPSQQPIRTAQQIAITHCADKRQAAGIKIEEINLYLRRTEFKNTEVQLTRELDKLSLQISICKIEEDLATKEFDTRKKNDLQADFAYKCMYAKMLAIEEELLTINSDQTEKKKHIDNEFKDLIARLQRQKAAQDRIQEMNAAFHAQAEAKKRMQEILNINTARMPIEEFNVLKDEYDQLYDQVQKFDTSRHSESEYNTLCEQSRRFAIRGYNESKTISENTKQMLQNEYNQLMNKLR